MAMSDLTSTQKRAPFRSLRRLAALKTLRDLAEIGDDESALILQSMGDATLAATGTELFRLGARLDQPRMILSGWAGLAVVLADGRRQLLDIELPGDLIGCSLHPDARAKTSVVCLTPVESIKITALADCLRTPERFAGLHQLVHNVQDQFESRLLNQIVRNGCQMADEKISSLLLELYARLAHVGLAQQNSFELPISQIVIGETLGLSTVHVNRTFQALKREKIIQAEGRHIAILNLSALCERAGNVRLPEPLDDPALPQLTDNAELQPRC